MDKDAKNNCSSLVPRKKKQSKQEQQQAAANAQADENSLVNKFKKSGETFLQELACHEMERLSMCRECRLPPNQRNKAFCRFYAFRRLRYNKNGQLAVFGFSDPKKDPDASDMQLWNPDRESPPTNLDLSTAKLILMYIVPHLCKLLSDEMNELRENLTQSKWKCKRYWLFELIVLEFSFLCELFFLFQNKRGRRWSTACAKCATCVRRHCSICIGRATGVDLLYVWTVTRVAATTGLSSI